MLWLNSLIRKRKLNFIIQNYLEQNIVIDKEIIIKLIEERIKKVNKFK